MLIGKKVWAFLKPGDTISVIAPSSPPSNPERSFGLEREYFKNTPYKLHIPEGLTDPTWPLEEANTIEKRVHFIQEALNSDAKVIWATSGGGWGMELLPLLKKMTMPKRVIPIVGYSDVTALHVFFNSVWNWPTLHTTTLGANGDILSDVAWNQTKISEVLDALTGKTTSLSYVLKPLNNSAKEARDVTCTYITGGNSLILSATNGSGSFQPRADSGILFIESIAIDPGIVSRILNGIRYGNITQRVKAVLFGDFIVRGGRPNPPLIQTQYDFLLRSFGEALDKRNIPVLKAENLFGHGKVNKVLPFNTPAALQLGSSPTLHVSING
ncbi:MAG: LD-carboxypeptidase [Alphaproteobacteria bacterium]|nr:LD-carboxypeptidase [Alphaproteobacteria bacterium]